MEICNDKKIEEELEVGDDFSVEDEAFSDIDDTEGDPGARIKKLKDELKSCTKERKEYLEGWQRMKADYLNSKKRHEEERMQIISRSESAFIEKILPLCDSFDMALSQEMAEGEVNAWRVGFSQIHSQLKSILAESKVTEIAPLGEPFDPHKHEALSSISVDNKMKHDTVVSVLQKGYMRGDTLLRPAKVIIGVFEG